MGDRWEFFLLARRVARHSDQEYSLQANFCVDKIHLGLISITGTTEGKRCTANLSRLSGVPSRSGKRARPSDTCLIQECIRINAHANGYGHPKCYARALGGCCDKITGEHNVSKGVLELINEGDGKVSRLVSVTGLAIQERDAIQELGVSRLKSKVLCDTHNNLLSPSDGAAKAMFVGMDSLNRATGDIASPERALPVDGDLLERWMLKALCGGLYSGTWLVGATETMKGVCPPLEWLQILFNGAQFPAGWVLYYMPAKADELITADLSVLRMEPLVSRGGQEVCAVHYWFFGFKFALLMGNLVQGVPTMFDNAMYRPAGLRAVGSSTRIRFDWSNGPLSRDIIVMRVPKQS